MGQTWTKYPGKNVICPGCGAEYAVTIRRIAHKDRDSYDCKCGTRIDEWNTTEERYFELIKPGTPATPA